MTGLDDAKDVILEVAVIITDLNFKQLDHYHAVIHQPPEVLDSMNAWCQKTHKESGLLAKIPRGIPLELADSDLLALIQKHFKKREKVVLCGNSVGNDQRFVLKYMPQVAKRLHYRIIDVSSYKELFRRKYGMKFTKKSSHRALNDITESINELKMYLSLVTPPKKKTTRS